MSRDWSVEGNASFGWYNTQRLCSSEPRTVLVQPAGTYARHGTVCHALGGALLTYTDLTPTIMERVRDPANACIDTDGPVTWLSGGQRAANGTVVAKVKTEEECPAMGVDGRVWAPCEEWLECSVCQVPSTVLYNLYGHDGRLFDHTYYSHNTSGHVMFRGLAGSEILRQEAGWLLRSSLHETQWLLPEAPVPVGRHRWSAAGEEEVVLTLTHCRTTQFACDDGQCVSQTDRCDDIVHCRDRSDEANCQVVERPPGYDPYYTPPPRPGEVMPTGLSYHIDVYNVGDVTTNVGEASMDVGITIAWFDPRLKFLNLKPRVKNYFPCHLVWTPRVRAISGSGEGNLLTTNDYEKFCYTYDNDETEQRPLHDPLMGHQAEGVSHAIETYLGVLAWVPCRFQLQMYPFDVQLCNLSFMVVNAPSTHVFRKSSPGNHVPYLNARRVLLEYVLEEQTTKVGWFLQGTDNNTYFVLTYHLRRLYGYHVMNSFFPSLLMFFISYATFYFQLEDFTNRIMISLTAQLVLAALFTSTTQSSVKTPYLKLIDVWYAAIITFCFLIIIAQTIINAVLHGGGRLPPALTSGEQMLRPLHRNKVEPLFTRRGDARPHAPTRPPTPPLPSGHRMARLCNAMARVLLFASVFVFVLIYSLAAAGLLHFQATADIGGAA
ncbi:uncharacterized protein [Panulirus ornatus]|uniref:uncharacterized protein n=1 Tax=Panulirus ornatus TaxID=150431 RepID=UPI003A835601